MFGFWTWVTVGYSTDLRLAVRVSQLCIPSHWRVRERLGNHWRTERWIARCRPHAFPEAKQKSVWAVVVAEVLRSLVEHSGLE